MVLGMYYCLLKKPMQAFFSTQYNILAWGLMCYKWVGGTKGILPGQRAQMHQQEQGECSLHAVRAVGAHLRL